MTKLLIRFHTDFFENDDTNMTTMGIGFAISCVCMLVVFGLYQL